MELALGNVFVRDSRSFGEGFSKAGHVVHGHKHNFDHLTLCWGGRIHIKALLPEGRTVETTVEPGDYRLIKAGVEHEITALDDGARFLCIYAHREPQGDVVQHYTGWAEAYG